MKEESLILIIKHKEQPFTDVWLTSVSRLASIHCYDSVELFTPRIQNKNWLRSYEHAKVMLLSGRRTSDLDLDIELIDSLNQDYGWVSRPGHEFEATPNGFRTSFVFFKEFHMVRSILRDFGIEPDRSQIDEDFIDSVEITEEEPVQVYPYPIKFKALRAGARLPKQATPGAAGWDLTAAEDVRLEPGQAVVVPTGWAVEIPPGLEMQVRSRSGLATKGVVVANSPGTIDSDYRGEVGVILINSGKAVFDIKKGDRVAQAVFAEVPRVSLEVFTELTPTDRGSGGFGSTGK